MDPPVRSGTGDSAAFFGNDNALSRRPKVPHGTQRRHLRLILSPKGAVRHSKATLTAYSVAQRCRAVLKGGTYGDFSSPESTATNYPVSKMRRSAHENDSEDPPVSRTRRSAHETSLEDSPVSRTRRYAHETTSEDPSVSRTRRSAHENDSEDTSVSRTRLFTHETAAKDTRGNRGAFSASYGNSTGTLRELYGNSTGAPRCRRGETRASATHRETWCLSGR